MEERRQEDRRASDRTINEIKQDIGELSGRMGSVEKSVSGIDDSLKLMIKENAVIAETHRMVIQHDKRLNALENRCHERKAILDAAEDHIEKDTPVKAVLGEYAIGAVLFFGGGAAMWLLSKLPKIITLLK